MRISPGVFFFPLFFPPSVLLDFPPIPKSFIPPDSSSICLAESVQLFSTFPLCSEKASRPGVADDDDDDDNDDDADDDEEVFCFNRII